MDSSMNSTTNNQQFLSSSQTSHNSLQGQDSGQKQNMQPTPMNTSNTANMSGMGYSNPIGSNTSGNGTTSNMVGMPAEQGMVMNGNEMNPGSYYQMPQQNAGMPTHHGQTMPSYTMQPMGMQHGMQPGNAMMMNSNSYMPAQPGSGQNPGMTSNNNPQYMMHNPTMMSTTNQGAAPNGHQQMYSNGMPVNGVMNTHQPNGAMMPQLLQMPPSNRVNQVAPQMSMQMSNGMVGYNGSVAMGMNQMQMANNNQQTNIPNNVQQAPSNSQSQIIGSATNGLGNTKTLKRAWHLPDHKEIRDNMVERIIQLLKQRRPQANEEWHDKLPHMAKRLEDALYGQAESLAEYADFNTLKSRLQQLALSIGGKPAAKLQQQQQAQQQQPSQGQGQQYPMGNHTMSMGMGGVYMQPQMQQMQQGQQPMPQQGQQLMQPPMQQSMQQSMQQGMQQPMQQPMQQTMQPPMGHMQQQVSTTAYINPMNSTYSANPQMYPMAPQPTAHANGQMAYTGMNEHNDAMNRQSYMTIKPVVNNGQNHMQIMEPKHGAQHYSQPMTNSYVMPNGMPAQMMNNAHMMQTQPQSYAPNGMPQMIPQNGSQTGQMQQGSQAVNAQATQMMMVPQHQPVNQTPQLGQTQMVSSVPNATPPMQSQNVQGVGFNGVNNNNNNNNNNNPNSNKNDDHRKQVLKQQQQRLLLLRHASKCPHESGKCPVTQHCANMKLLWKHIMSCKDQECKVPHCVSSRYVLSHYSKCKDTNCPVCGPVREAIRINHERSQDLVKSIPPYPQNNNGAVRSGNVAVRPPPTPQPRTRLFPLDPISCPVYCFSEEQINAHFQSIHEGLRFSAVKIRENFMPLLENLLRNQRVSVIFGAPVDAVGLGLTNYHEIITEPMDLGTIKKRLIEGSYRDASHFVADVRLTFDNAMLFNGKGSDIYNLAKQSKNQFDSSYKNLMDTLKKNLEEDRKRDDACLICGEVKLSFEPPVYYCNGRCGERIRRNAHYYSTANNNYHWCTRCYGEIKENETIQLPDSAITKADLGARKKHCEDSEESWVQCDSCERWVHQICGLFNSRRNISDDVHYVCPNCVREKKRTSPESEVVKSVANIKMTAKDLPHNNMTVFLENRIYERLEICYEQAAAKLKKNKSEIEKCPTLYLRQVSCYDKNHTVRDGVFNRYRSKNYPAEFPCRVKCVVLFQNIEGQDVILFGMYVYEYGHKCPQPNQRRVYISYLDSVNYFRPKQYRTTIYHEILISYLDYVKARGFHTVHIWACPPQKGDDYILYVHPQDQKTPKPEKLKNWYLEILVACQQRGIVSEISDMHTEFLADPSNDATVLPYFEGDYWVNEAEEIIKKLGDKNADPDDDDDKELELLSRRRNKSSTRPGRSARTTFSLRSERDPLMTKLANIIEPMKETFLVARMHPREYAEQKAHERQDEIDAESNEKGVDSENQRNQQLQDEALSSTTINTDIPASKKVAEKSQASSTLSSDSQAEGDAQQISADMFGRGDDNQDNREVTPDVFGDDGGAESVCPPCDPPPTPRGRKRKAESLSEPVEVSTSSSTSVVASEAKDSEEISSSDVRIKEESMSSMVTSDIAEKVPMEISETSSTSPEVKSEVKVELPMGLLPPSEWKLCPVPIDKDDTEDVDVTQESEHFETRQAFLNLCQGNHYQYDQLRRAKHSSMMVLYHIHNPDAPKFVPSCSACHKDILVGTRYHCDSCDIDYCPSCYEAQGGRPHHHSLRLATSNANNQPTKLTEEQRRERQRSIELHMQLLTHAANCDKECKSRNCSKMKEFLKHQVTCTLGKSCRICVRVNNLLQIHARSCKLEHCRVPKCHSIRDYIRGLEKRQQQMDDRRRALVNEIYRGGSSTPAPSKERDEEDEQA